MNQSYAMSGSKLFNIEGTKCHGKIVRKKNHGKKWNQNLLSQFSLEKQLVTCFTDDSIFQNAKSNKSLASMQKCIGKLNDGTFPESNKCVESVIDKPVALNCIETKSSPIPAITHQSSSKVVTSTETNLSSACSIWIDAPPDRVNEATDLQAYKREESFNSLCKGLSEDLANQKKNSIIGETQVRIGTNCPVFQTSGSFKTSGKSVELIPKNKETVSCSKMTPKEACVNTQLGSCPSVQRRFVVTSFMSNPEITVPKKGSGDDLDKVPRISIETFHFELENMAVVSIDNVSLNDNFPGGYSKSIEKSNYPTDWQVVSNQTFTMHSATNPHRLEKHEKEIFQTCGNSGKVSHSNCSSCCLNQSRRFDSSCELSSMKEVNSHLNSMGKGYVLDPVSNLRYSTETRNVGYTEITDEISTLENVQRSRVMNAATNINSFQECNDDVWGKTNVLRGDRIQDSRSEGTFVPIKSKGVRFVSQMKVVLKRNPRADQMACGLLTNRSCSSYSNKLLNVNQVLGSDSFSCLRCSVNFTTFQNLMRHLDGHKSEKVYICYYCQKRFRSNSDTVRHMRSHTGERPFHCPDCNKSFTRLHNMKTHRSIHNDVRNKFCEMRGKIAPRIDNLLPHLATSTPGRLHKCDVCGKLFSSQMYLDVHMPEHFEAALPVNLYRNQEEDVDDIAVQISNECQKTEKVVQLTELSYPIDTYRCDWCSRLFTSIKGMKIHSKIIHKKGLQ